MKAFGRFIYFFALVPAVSGAADWRLKVNAGPVDRVDCLLSFPLPSDLHGPWALKAEGEVTTIPVQVCPDGNAVFILPKLAKHTEATFSLLPAESLKDFQIAEVDHQLRMATPDGQEIAGYQMEAGPVPEGVNELFRHGAHLHPIFSPAGRLVTGNHPEDHRWHRGVWMAWTDTEFEGRHPDFWNMGKEATGLLTGEVRFEKLVKRFAGPVAAGFESQHRFIDHTGGSSKDVLVETWQVLISRLGKDASAVNVIDLVSLQKCAGSEPLKLPKYHYGGLGVRGNPEWNPAKEVTMLTSNGDDRKAGDGTKAKWVHLGGKVDGQPTGMVVLIHPENFRFPQPLRLNPKNPQLCIAPSADGDWVIEPGQTFTSRYRLAVMDGAANKDSLERLWEDYAHPPTVTLTH